jgi:HD superfamily phosphohydrolase
MSGNEEKRKLDGKAMVDNAIEQLREQIELRNSLTDELNQYRSGKLPDLLKKKFGVWVQPRQIDGTKGFYLLDPIYGAIFIEEEIAPVFLQPIFQRLNEISQLSFARFKYPAATHTRLSHCIGVARNVEDILTIMYKRGRIKENPRKMKYITMQAKFAALLHDLGHGPFGHALDKYAGIRLDVSQFGNLPSYRMKPDKFFSVEYIGKYLKETIDNSPADIKYTEVQALLDPQKRSLKGYDRFIADMVDSALDADRMDYLVRDSHFTGIAMGRIGTTFLQENVVPYLKGDTYTLNYCVEALPYIEHFLYARQSMYVTCYEDDTKISAEAMLVRAVEEFTETFKSSGITLRDIMLLTDVQLLDLLMDMTDKNSLIHKLTSMLRQQAVFVKVYERPVAFDPEKIKNARVKSYRVGTIKPTSDPLAVYKGDSDLWAQDIGGQNYKENVIVVPPYPEAFEHRELNIGLVDAEGFPKEVHDTCPALKEKVELWNKERLRIRVFVSPLLSKGDRDSLHDRAKALLEDESA